MAAGEGGRVNRLLRPYVIRKPLKRLAPVWRRASAPLKRGVNEIALQSLRCRGGGGLIYWRRVGDQAINPVALVHV